MSCRLCSEAVAVVTAISVGHRWYRAHFTFTYWLLVLHFFRRCRSGTPDLKMSSISSLSRR
jgi:hypothetical protein